MSLIDELKAALGPGAVFSGDEVPDRARSDASETGQHRPLALLRPATTQEVSTALAICFRHNQSVVPQGGMTGLAGGANPRPGDIALSLDRLSGVEEIDLEAACITLRAGTVLQTAQEAAAAQGFLLPIDLGARGSCQIGGVIANNAGGLRVIRHGMTRDHVLGLEVVLADGTILSSMAKLVKNNTGYNLAQLFTGSEGTLGIITRAVLRLRPLAKDRCTALCAADDFSAIVGLLKLARKELPGLSALEVMWQDYFAALEKAEGLVLFTAPPNLAVILESEASDDPDHAAKFEAFLARAFDAGLLSDALIARSSRDADAFWSVREGHKLTQIMPAIINFDISLDIGRMGEFVTTCQAALGREFPDARALFFGHAGDGNLHIVADDPSPESAHRMELIVYDLVRAMGGSISAEHGIGTLKRDYLGHSRSPEELAAMRAIKGALDPIGILNPGKLV